MKLKAVIAAAILLGAAALAYGLIALPRLKVPDSDMLAAAEVVALPWQRPAGLVYLLSGADGYGPAEAATARRLALSGLVVVGVDTPKTLLKGAATAAKNDDCAYFVSDMEQMSQDLQRSLELPNYHSPMIAGAGLGGTFALALAAQTPDATIGRTIAVDPGKVLPMERELCSGASHRKAADGSGWIYDLQPGELPDPIDVYETAAADPDGARHVASLKSEGFAVNIVKADAGAEAALRAAVVAGLAGAGAAGNPLADLPLSPIPAKPAHDTMAIFVSGDGGWRDIDKEIGAALAKGGVPTVGLDALRYFWNERKPEETAADLARVIDAYAAEWGVHKVALIGYSFGADLLPSVYDALPDDKKAMVSQISLLAYSGARQFEIQVSGILGMSPDAGGPSTVPDLEKIPPQKVQCFYGTDDAESVCGHADIPGIELVARPGGHHFDENYAPIAADLLARIAR